LTNSAPDTIATEWHRWPTILREAIPGLTAQDVDWLSSLQGSLSGPLPPPPPPTARLKRMSVGRLSPGPRRARTGPDGTDPREPTRRSTRSNTAIDTREALSQAQEAPPPSPLAASHSHLKPQFAQAFTRLYGTTQHRGIMASNDNIETLLPMPWSHMELPLLERPSSILPHTGHGRYQQVASSTPWL
jgi:hypothetical protein